MFLGGRNSHPRVFAKRSLKRPQLLKPLDRHGCKLSNVNLANSGVSPEHTEMKKAFSRATFRDPEIPMP